MDYVEVQRAKQIYGKFYVRILLVVTLRYHLRRPDWGHRVWQHRQGLPWGVLPVPVETRYLRMEHRGRQPVHCDDKGRTPGNDFSQLAVDFPVSVTLLPNQRTG